MTTRPPTIPTPPLRMPGTSRRPASSPPGARAGRQQAAVARQRAAAVGRPLSREARWPAAKHHSSGLAGFAGQVCPTDLAGYPHHQSKTIRHATPSLLSTRPWQQRRCMTRWMTLLGCSWCSAMPTPRGDAATRRSNPCFLASSGRRPGLEGSQCCWTPGLHIVSSVRTWQPC